ncbi:MAG TPA: NUDIX hydrolase [Rhodopila sp.]|nr:NUDIX hydrolase [Rhodopila sp.]
MTNSFRTESSRIAYANRWLRVREDRIRRPDGTEGLYGVVERPAFVVVVPFRDGKVTLVEQYRYPIQARIWEFPMGMWEDRPNADPATLAAGELREETGLIAREMHHAGTIFQGPGYCTQRGHVFLATGLTQQAAEREATEQDMICREFSLAAFEAMIRDGTVQDAMTMASFALLRLKGML